MWKTLKSLKVINSVDFMQQNVDIKYIKCYIGLYTDLYALTATRILQEKVKNISKQ